MKLLLTPEFYNLEINFYVKKKNLQQKSVITDCSSTSSTTNHQTQKLRIEMHYLIKFEFEPKDMA